MRTILFNRPPQHTIDTVSKWIHPADPAWDLERAEVERQRLREAAIANLPENATLEEQTKAADAAQNKHPIAVWYTGATRYSLTAKHTVPERLRTAEHPEPAVPITAYMTGTPRCWVIRSLGAVAYREVLSTPSAVFGLTAARHGLVRVEDPDNDEPIEPDRKSPSSPISMEWIDMVDQQDRSILNQLGMAIFSLSEAKGVGDEGKL
jgi:hypothetical protein